MNNAQKILIQSVEWYQKHLSPDHSDWAKATNRAPFCRYIPSCSEYMIDAVKEYGAISGFGRGFWRICRCNPFSKGGYDPVKKENKK